MHHSLILASSYVSFSCIDVPFCFARSYPEYSLFLLLLARSLGSRPISFIPCSQPAGFFWSLIAFRLFSLCLFSQCCAVPVFRQYFDSVFFFRFSRFIPNVFRADCILSLVWFGLVCCFALVWCLSVFHSFICIFGFA